MLQHEEEHLRMKEIAFLEAERRFYEEQELKEWESFQEPARIIVFKKVDENDRTKTDTQPLFRTY